MQTRRYQPGEEQEIWRLRHDTTHQIIGQVYTPAQVKRWAPQDKDMEEWRQQIARLNPFVVVKDRQILGYGDLEPDGHIDSFYVHHQWQRRGVGQLLYASIEAEARRLNLPLLYAEVSLTAKDFFLRQGWEILEERRKVICGDPAPNFIMRKVLGLAG